LVKKFAFFHTTALFDAMTRGAPLGPMVRSLVSKTTLPVLPDHKNDRTMHDHRR